MRVIRSKDSFNPAMRFSTWIYTITRNYCRNQLRDQAIHFEGQVLELDETSHQAPTKDAGEKLQNGELGMAIHSALQELSENQREIFIMREIDGQSHQDIAEILNLNEGNVRTQLHRAKQHLQELLSPYLKGNR